MKFAEWTLKIGTSVHLRDSRPKSELACTLTITKRIAAMISLSVYSVHFKGISISWLIYNIRYLADIRVIQNFSQEHFTTKNGCQLTAPSLMWRLKSRFYLLFQIKLQCKSEHGSRYNIQWSFMLCGFVSSCTCRSRNNYTLHSYYVCKKLSILTFILCLALIDIDSFIGRFCN